MSKHNQRGDRTDSGEPLETTETHTLELREEELVASRDLRELGEIELRAVVDEIPGHLEIDAMREEVVIEHEPMGQLVSERRDPWEDGEELVVPIYEEQLVVSKRLVLREHLRIRRVRTTERQTFDDVLRRERLIVADPDHTGLVHERYSTDDPTNSTSSPEDTERGRDQPDEGLLSGLMRKVLE